MKVIFLDIDGVLNTFVWRHSLGLDFYRTHINPEHMHHLKRIVDATGAKIVLTSSWRRWLSLGEKQDDPAGQSISDAFQAFGLKIYDKTPIFDHEQRSVEIDTYLSQHPGITDWVILDDVDFDWTPAQQMRFVQTDGHDIGLTAELAETAIHALNGTLLQPQEEPPERIFERLRKLISETYFH